MRTRIRLWVELIAVGLTAPLVLAHRLRLVTYATAGEVLAMIPGMVGVMLRRAWYRQTLDQCGVGLSVSIGAVLHNQRSRIGDNCHFGPYSRIGLATIGNDVMVATRGEIISGAHQYATSRARPLRTQRLPPERVQIGADVWIGASSVVGADIATGTIVATGAVVVKPQSEPYSLVGGVPARRLGERR